MSDELPAPDEVALGAFLEDIGKFMQRAHAGNNALPEPVMERASVVLSSFDGRSSHWHALWTDAFFHELEQKGVSLPGGLNLDRVRNAAVYHHHPSSPLHWLSAEADRLSAGMDRKPKDEEAERADGGSRNGFRRTALHSVFSSVSLGLGTPPTALDMSYEVAELEPTRLVRRRVEGAAQQQAYQGLWSGFRDAFIEQCHTAPNLELFHEGLLSISERYTWAIPSSTIDQPDISLHDHNKSVAAIAACLYLFHRERGELDNEERITDRSLPKYRFLAGDLSGIQAALFRLASQQVKGVARILRARSFLMGALVEAAALTCRRAIGLPPYCELQSAGGRFLLLVPDLSDLDTRIDALRRKIEQWLAERYLGDLALNLALGPVLAGKDLLHGQFAETMAAVNQAIKAAKQRPLSTVKTGVLRTEYPAGAEGACSACGVRPATHNDDRGIMRCLACHDEHEVGRRLPKSVAVLWSVRPLPSGIAGHRTSVEMPGGLSLALFDEPIGGHDRDAWRVVISGWQPFDGEPSTVALPRRHVANYVPRLGDDELCDPRFDGLSEEAREAKSGDAKTFEHLAALAREPANGGYRGRPMLAVLKADVDRLGQIFAHGLGGNRSLGRMAALSRLFDRFFTAVLPDILHSEYPDIYTVYAGGDDLLLLGPWTKTIELAASLEQAFGRYVGSNPNITLSAGIEFCGINEPLNRVVRRADSRVEEAKAAGRNRVCLIAKEPITWLQLRKAIDDADQISRWVRDANRPLSTAFVYKTLSFSREKAEAESPQASLRSADWRARWHYHLARAFDRRREEDAKRLIFFGQLLGENSAAPEIPLVIALYRNR